MFTVYILFLPSNNKHYTGFTTDLKGRLISHNQLGNGWTSRHRPWTLLFKKDFKIKKEALQYEKWLKSGQGRTFIKTIPH